MTNFRKLDISDRLKNTLATMGYEEATEIQEKTIPAILSGQDVLASSQTGSGKTGGFLIPLISKIETDKEGRALIVAPTRELAKQVCVVASKMMGNQPYGATALLIGGEEMFKQIRQLKSKPKLVIGTPGRINDHLQRGILKLGNTKYLVLDETDRMLDMGFSVQIDEILQHMPEERQTSLFSATLPKAIIKLSEKYLNNPVRIAVGDANSVAKKITQNTINTEDKFGTLVEELEKTSGSVLIFARTQRSVERLNFELSSHPYKTEILHGGLRQTKRERVMRGFRNQKFNVLIATDVAARGLDVPHIEFVINYDLPDSPEDYVHRIGRTARAERSGVAISFISRQEKIKWRAIQRFLNGDEDEELTLNRGRRPGGSRGRGGDRRDSRGGRGGDRRGNGRRDGGNDRRRSFNRDDDFGYKRDSESRESRDSFGGGDRYRSSSRDGESRRGSDERRHDSSNRRRSSNRDGESRGNYSRDGESRRDRGNSENGNREYSRSSGGGRRRDGNSSRGRNSGNGRRGGRR